MFFKIIRPWEQGLVEHLGKYKRTADSGLTLVIPFVQRMVRIDMREQVVDVPPQNVITKDNVVVNIDAVVYYQVVDPVKVTYNVVDFYSAVTKLAQTNLRNLIGDLALDETLTSRERVNSELWGILEKATDDWGVKVNRVALQRIDPPKDVTKAMHRQMKAEREKRAKILEAEGRKQAAILEEEGRKQAAILEEERWFIKRKGKLGRNFARTREVVVILSKNLSQAFRNFARTREVVVILSKNLSQAFRNSTRTRE